MNIATSIIMSQLKMYQSNMPYPLNLHNDTCQIYSIKKLGVKKCLALQLQQKKKKNNNKSRN